MISLKTFSAFDLSIATLSRMIRPAGAAGGANDPPQSPQMSVNPSPDRNLSAGRAKNVSIANIARPTATVPVLFRPRDLARLCINDS